MDRSGFRVQALGFFNRHRNQKVLAILLPCIFWIGVFFLVPLCMMGMYSFLQRGLYGGVTWIFTSENYVRFADSVYVRILMRTLRVSLLVTAFLLVIGYPLAYKIARAGKRWRNMLLFLVILPFWTSDLIRTYAWMLILRDTGLLNNLLQYLHITREPLTLLYTEGAVLLGLIYVYLPFMVLPLYASIEKLDPALLEAAEDLGASPLWRFLKVTVPLTKSGILAGSLLVFIPSVGAFVVPDLLGGAKTMMTGNLVQLQFGAARNWPFGSAVSFILMIVVLAAVFSYLKFTGGEAVLEETE